MGRQVGDVWIPDWYKEQGQVFITLDKLPEAHSQYGGKARYVCLVATTSWRYQRPRGSSPAVMTTWQTCACSDDVFDVRIEIK